MSFVVDRECAGPGVLTTAPSFSLSSGVLVGVGVGFLWCCLTAVAVACLMKARGEIMEQRDMEDLLKAEKAGPIASSSSSSPPDDKKDEKDAELGKLNNNDHSTDSDDESDPFNQTKNDRLAPRARAEVAKSVRASATAGAGAVGAHRVSHGRSMVVTARPLDDIEESKDGALRHSAKARLASGPEVTTNAGPGRRQQRAAAEHSQSMAIPRSDPIRASAVRASPNRASARVGKSMVVASRSASMPLEEHGGESDVKPSRASPNRASARHGKSMVVAARSASMPTEEHNGGESDVKRSVRKSSSMGDEGAGARNASMRQSTRGDAARQSTRRKGTSKLSKSTIY